MPHNYCLPIHNSEQLFSVNKIICIGRNYAEHAREMGHDPEREPPFFFFKPQSALSHSSEEFVYPHYTQRLEHKVELVVAIGKTGYQISAADAHQYVCGFGIGLDMTCRDIQQQAKQQGRPWELAKGFDGSAPCSALVPASLADLNAWGDLVLTRNGEEVQRGNWRDMVWSIPELIAQVSHYIQLHAGDLIFTGTPAGVGEVKSGDQLAARMEGFPETLDLKVYGP